MNREVFCILNYIISRVSGLKIVFVFKANEY